MFARHAADVPVAQGARCAMTPPKNMPAKKARRVFLSAEQEEEKI